MLRSIVSNALEISRNIPQVYLLSSKELIK